MVHLREYLEMARAVSGGIRRETVRPVDEGHDLHLKSIVSALEARDLVVGSNVGLSSFRVDIAITVKGMEDRWLVGVLLDGPNWASRMLVSDRDALPVDVLQNKMGWRRVERIWLPSWRANPSEIIGDLEALARRLALEPEPEPEVDTSEPEAKVFPESTKVEADVAAETAPPAVQGSSNSGQERMASLELVRRSFVPIPKVKTTTTLDDLNADRARGVRCVNDLLRMCGPLRSDVVLKATLNRFGLNQVNANRLREYADLIDPTQLVKSKFGDFAFPEELVGPQGLRRDVFNWYQASKFSERKLDEISPQEFANCAAAIVRGSFSIGEAELASAVLTEFGYSRKTADAIDLATSMIQWCVTEGYFTSSDGTLRIS
jgi:hypothetical protein